MIKIKVNLSIMDRHTEVLTLTSSSNLQLRGQRRSKFETVSNDKNNKANLLIMDRKTKCPRSPYGLTYHLMLKFMPNVIISVIGQMHITHKQGIEKGGNIVPRT